MPRQLEAEGLVLDRKQAGENHLRLTLLSPTLGIVLALTRESRPAGSQRGTLEKAKSAPQRPDIFDHASVLLEVRDDGDAHSNIYFLREYKIIRRHGGLGRSYAALEAASGIATLVAHNAKHFETCARVFDLCKKALDALDTGASPEAVVLKALFILANAEGYAAKEQWLPGLSEADQLLALTILTRPTAEAAALAAEDTSRLPKLRQTFERWLERTHGY